MPELSRFLGLLIKMQYNDHPPPHFHVWYGGRKQCSVDIRKAEIIVGELPRPQAALVIAWTYLHQRELLEAWEAARNGVPPGKIQPLESKSRRKGKRT